MGAIFCDSPPPIDSLAVAGLFVLTDERSRRRAERPNELCSSKTDCHRVFTIEKKLVLNTSLVLKYNFYGMTSSPPYVVTCKLSLVVRSSRLIHLIVALTPPSKLPPNEPPLNPPPTHSHVPHLPDGTWSVATPTTTTSTTTITNNIFPPGSLSVHVYLWTVEALKSATSHTHKISCVCLQP